MSDSSAGGAVQESAARTSPKTSEQASEPSTRGILDVRSAAIEHLAEHIAADVAGTVNYRSNMDKLRGRGYPHAEVSIRGASSWITLDIAVAWPGVVEDIASTARDQVRTETTRLSGSDVRRVDVTVHVLTADQVGAPERRVR
ncbi:hypothetical protein [Allobranchiibius sp. CTAmp26]|uniref:hypothetical protein n=1 Tax=Allobranchiibius sp. CTAmp26 TaxID=2815214 RepID=UPI001AA16E55|nr:hypothetical protein [Allobranchiibius sp. CTAmp26]MBO1755019.1 hypothetical protein [Allobranchiibius sp. CTAmp26]